MILFHTVNSEEETFKVGGKYENRKGPFEVVSLVGDMMRIRWDSGEETETEISFQTKIRRNMERELLEVPKGKTRSPKWFGESFAGLRPDDFKNDVTGTHWRSREQLGGAVSRLLNGRAPFNSWAIYKRPEIHWASTRRYQTENPWLLAKFFARLQEESILFGLYIERSDDPDVDREDWIHFREWTKLPGHSKWLHEVLSATDSVLTHPYPTTENQAFSGTITAKNGQFVHESVAATCTFEIEDLPNYLAGFDEVKWVNFLIGKRLSRDEAITEGAHVAAVLSAFFNALLPVYENRVPDAFVQG